MIKRLRHFLDRVLFLVIFIVMTTGGQPPTNALFESMAFSLIYSIIELVIEKTAGRKVRLFWVKRLKAVTG